MASDNDAIGSVIERATATAAGQSSNAGDWSAEHVRQLEDLRSEIERLKESVATVASSSANLASGAVDFALNDIEETLKRNVFMSVGIAALVGYIWGRTR